MKSSIFYVIDVFRNEIARILIYVAFKDPREIGEMSLKLIRHFAEEKPELLSFTLVRGLESNLIDIDNGKKSIEKVNVKILKLVDAMANFGPDVDSELRDKLILELALLLHHPLASTHYNITFLSTQKW